MSYHDPVESLDPVFCVCGISMEYHALRSADWIDAREEDRGGETPSRGLDAVSVGQLGVDEAGSNAPRSAITARQPPTTGQG